jgi:hypothetical protein
MSAMFPLVPVVGDAPGSFRLGKVWCGSSSPLMTISEWAVNIASLIVLEQANGDRTYVLATLSGRRCDGGDRNDPITLDDAAPGTASSCSNA